MRRRAGRNWTTPRATPYATKKLSRYWRRSRPQKLNPRRQIASRAQNSRHLLRRRNLPPPQHPRARLVGCCPPPPRQRAHRPLRPSHSYRLGSAQPLISTHPHIFNHVVALTLTLIPASSKPRPIRGWDSKGRARTGVGCVLFGQWHPFGTYWHTSSFTFAPF